MTTSYRAPVSDEDRGRAAVALHAVALALSVAPGPLRQVARADLRLRRVRWMAMYLAHVGYGWSMERVGHVFGPTRTSVATACRWVEDARDDPGLDTLLERLEQALRQISSPACVPAHIAGRHPEPVT